MNEPLVIRAIEAWGQHPPMSAEETRETIECLLRQRLPEGVWSEVAWELGL